ncbi:MAG: 50S ribosomal protein L10 [Deltaproteobacteria bacterium]|nr:50S ribosomal protein L10 [Deltaproteobacteria bacterium]
MAVLTRAQKEEQVAELNEKFSRATSVYVADYRGLSVDAANKLRGRIHKEGAGNFEYRVAKNSILRRASAELAVAGIAEHFQGPTSIAISFGDPVGLAKILSDFAKENEVFELKGGVVDGEVVDSAQIAALAKLPSMDELRGTIVGLLQAPATKLVRLISEPGAQLARLVEARRAQQGEA